MGRLTKIQEKKHDEALALLSLTRRLNDEEVEFCFRNYQPMACHRVTRGAIYFTPYEVASDFVVMARLQCGGRVIDYAAGIGVLTHHMLAMEHWDSGDDAKQHVCVEIESEFVEVGKKLVPSAEWICGNIFDRELMQSLGTFRLGIANPPFGAIPSLAPAKKWMKAKVPAHLATVELMLRMCELGGYLIVPRVDQEIQRNGYIRSQALERLYQAFPGVWVSMCHDLDSATYPQWQAVDPNVVIADVNVDDVKFVMPYGFDDVKEEPATCAPIKSAEIPQQLGFTELGAV